MNITMIPTSKIYSHPLNPRTDLGDITELTDSIKAMGILQNLTVVPYSPVDHAGLTITDGDGSDCYVVVVGNRRHAAGQQAKLAELPCAISNMDIKEQIRTMQVENLMREGLTTYQQAKAIQMMLDLGDTIEDIAKATGLSKSKVEKKAKLAIFDQAAFAATEARNETIPMDHYLKAAKLDDPEERNKLLESVGTTNFDYELSRAKDRIKGKARRVEQKQVVDTFAKQVDKKEDDFISVKTIYSSTAADEIEVPADAGTCDYFYVEESWGAISLYRRKTAGEVAAAADLEQEKAKQQANYIQLEEASKRAFELRVAFVEKLTAAAAKKHFATIAQHLADYLRDLSLRGYQNLRIDHHLAAELLGIAMSEDEKDGIRADDLKEMAQKCPERTILILCYLQVEDNDLSYVKQEWKTGCYYTVPKPEPMLDRIYALLTDIGYQMSDEEKQMQDGSHPLFYKEPEKKAKPQDETSAAAA